jgi:hypothetical protein
MQKKFLRFIFSTLNCILQRLSKQPVVVRHGIEFRKSFIFVQKIVFQYFFGRLRRSLPDKLQSSFKRKLTKFIHRYFISKIGIVERERESHIDL